MQNSIWKLTALAGVVGIGFLVVLQAQRGLSQQADRRAEQTADETASTGPQAGQSNGEFPPGHLAESGSDSPVPFGHQYEPDQPSGDSPAGPTGFATVNSGDGRETISQTSAEPPAQPIEYEDEPYDEPGLLPAGSSEMRSASTDSAGAGESNPFSTAAPERSTSSTIDSGLEPAGHEQPDEEPSPSEPDRRSEPIDSPEESPAAGDPADSGPRLAVPVVSPGANAAGPASPSEEEKSDESPAFVREPTRTHESQPPDASPFGELEPEAADPPAVPNDPEHPPGSRFQPGAPTEEMTEPNPGKSAVPNQPDPSPFGADEPDPAAVEEEPQLRSREKEEPALDDEQGAARQPRGSESAGEPGEQVPADAAARPAGKSEPPKRLDLPPDAARLDPPSEDLTGDGTVDPDAPRGPQQPRLSIEKIAPENAALGKPLIYTIVVKNVGDSSAYQVAVEDRIPKGSTLTGTIPQAQLADKRLLWRLGELKAGEERKIMVRVVPQEAGTIGSVATVNFVAEVAARTRVTAPKLALTIAGPKQARLGEPVTFQFKVTNTGTADARGVWIRDVIPDGLKHPAGKDLEYEVGQLPAGQSKEIKLTLTAARVGETVNRGIVTADGGVRLEEKVPVEIVGTRLVVTRTGPKRSYVGRKAVYANLITNDSDAAATGVSLTETVPNGMEFVEATDGGRYDAAERTVTWTVGQLAPRESRTVKVTLLAKATGAQAGLVRASDAGGGTAQVASKTEVEGFAAVRIEIPPVGAPAAVGEAIPLRIVARNQGTAPATNVRIQVTIPDETEVTSVRGPGKHTQADGRIAFEPIADLKPGRTAELDLVLKATAAGDVRVGVQIDSDQMKQPLTREEAVLIVPKS